MSERPVFRHTEACHASMLRDITKAFELGMKRGAYLQQWPNACQYCGATGGFYTANTQWDPPDYDNCPACIDLNKCPRCAHPFRTEVDGNPIDDLVCLRCHWDYEHGGDFQMPPSAAEMGYGECDCYGQAYQWERMNEYITQSQEE